MSGLGSRVLHPDDKRELLLDAAEGVFCRLGYARTTMSELAGAAGVTRPTIYAYFASKDDVFRALVDRVREEFLRLQEQPGRAVPREIVREALAAYLAAYVRHFGMLTIIAHQALSDPQMRRLRDQIHDRANRRHARFIQRLVDQGLARTAVPPELVAEAVTGIVMRFAEETTARPERLGELTDALVALYGEWTGLA